MVKENEEKNPYIRRLPILLVGLFLIFFAGNLSVITSQPQQDIITKEMKDQIKKDSIDIVNQLQSATPKRQKIIIESYNFKPEIEKGIFDGLEILERGQKLLEEIPSDAELDPLTKVMHETMLVGLDITKIALTDVVEVGLLYITRETFESQNKNVSSYSEVLNSFFIIIVTFLSVFSLMLINFRRFFEKKEANAEIGKCENWSDTLQYAHKRLLNEEKYMERLNIANLTSGIIIAGLGVLWFLFFVFPLDRVVDFDSFLNFVATYWPRFGIVIIVGILAVFFLRLYTKTIRRIDRNKNEITNIELRLTSGLMLCDEKDRGRLKSLANELSKEERNFVLDKNESSAILDTDKLIEIASKFTPKIGF